MDNVFIISEIAQAHDGSLGMAHSYIDALAQSGVDAIKFQTHIAEAESSDFEEFRVPFSYQDRSRFDYWKRMEFTAQQWAGLKEHCDQKGVEFMSSPFSVAAVEMLEKIGVKRYKIGSGELSNYLMLHHVAQTGKPIILSSGMSDWTELDRTISFLKPYGNELTLLQCTTAYPTLPNQWGLSVIKEMRDRYQVSVGFSDHSGDIVASTAAAALGAQVIEFHVVFDRQMFGPDSRASITIDETTRLVKGIKQIREALKSSALKDNHQGFSDLKTMFGKSLAVNKNLPGGHILALSDLESKKPAGKGISADQFLRVVGTALVNEKKQWEFLQGEDLRPIKD
jgi:N,N'-diacetyllegionaminate synthase